MRKSILLILCILMLVGLCGCKSEPEIPTCKSEGCEELELYQEGYCKYHYYLSVGDTILKELVN